MAPLLDPKTNRDTAKAFEESLWTKGSVLADEFYKAPDNTLNAPPGTVLKVEANTDPALYALPPGTAISRIMYQSQTLGGAPVPVTSSPETYSQKTTCWLPTHERRLEKQRVRPMEENRSAVPYLSLMAKRIPICTWKQQRTPSMTS